jgi:KipI family sensor histidine kinase inhibitor
MFKYFPLGDSSFIVKVGNDITPETNRKIRDFVSAIDNANIKGIIELIPAYNEIQVCYNPKEISYTELLEKLRDLENKTTKSKKVKTKLIYVPVCYEKEFAIDISVVAKTNNITVQEVIKIHTDSEYLVYMLGFTPGFCYLGGMNKKIATPRKENPRNKIEAGAVGIAGNQTGIYPIDSPGGWQIIGKTPLKLFDPKRKPEFLVEAGNYLKFYSISRTEFDKIDAMVSENSYKLKTEIRNG